MARRSEIRGESEEYGKGKDLKMKKCVAYFRSFKWESQSEIGQKVISWAQSESFESVDILSDERSSESESYNFLMNNLSNWSSGTFVIPSLCHLEEVVHDLDSFLSLFQLFHLNNIHFVSLDDDLNSNEPADIFMSNLFAATVRARAALKSSRIRHAQLEAKKSGYQVGAVKKRDDEQIIKLRAEGLTIKQIAERLGISTWPVQEALREFREASEL
ncbi:recombinase family protein [Bdellovibrio bacteriovorus]|uniref:recombinase family protein n=1 Tax=Bdellovibrio bacteriovorus TaxID=959 RepID=UPI003AA8656C